MELSPQEFYPQFWLEMSPRKCPHTRKRKCPHRNCLYRKRPRIDERNFPRRNSHYRNSPYRNLVVTNWMENSRAKRVFCFEYIRSTFNWLTAWFAIITFLVTLILFQAFLPNLNSHQKHWPKAINKQAKNERSEFFSMSLLSIFNFNQDKILVTSDLYTACI